MKIYTRTGDDGTTGLIGGSRVPKCDPRIACCGTVDELNAALGLAAVVAEPRLLEMIRQVQADLFVIGSHLATTDERPRNSPLPSLDAALIARLEAQIDECDAKLPALTNFILPGGSDLAARLHLARTVCRRAERLVVELSLDRPAPQFALKYLNRLSDWIFVQARWANHVAGVSDIPWSGSDAT